MESEALAREYLAANPDERSAQRSSPLGWLGLGPSTGVNDRLAYRLGRSGKEINEHILKAKVAAINENVTRRILDLRLEFASLRAQEGDLLGHIASIVAIFFGLTVLVAALLVDYRIIHEFWTRAVMDELGRVPASLRSSVYFKSGQVVFATLAFHFMLDTVGEAGRKVFKIFLFILTFAMLLGIGYIVASNWLPPGSALFGVDLHAAARSGQDVLAQLGLPSDTKTAPGGTQLADNLNTLRTLIWLGSLSMIFIIVTGVGALSLRNAVHSFQVLSGAEAQDFRPSGNAGARVMRRRRLNVSRKERMEQLKIEADRFGIQLDAPRVRSEGIENSPQDYNQNNGRLAMERRAIIRKGLLDFADSYAAGLHDWQSGFFGIGRAAREERARDLLQSLGVTLERLNGYVEEYVASHSIPYLDKPEKPAKRSSPSLAWSRDDERSGTDD
jgi:hypothetical protein